MPAAAAVGDTISHTLAPEGLVTGAVVGLALGLAAIATVATGGVAGVLICTAIVAGDVAGTALGEMLGALIPAPPVGPILPPGSLNVLVGGRPAARAMDMVTCAVHFQAGAGPIAQGSTTVLVNGLMMARKSDKVFCGAGIGMGCASVLVGGGTGTVAGLEPDEVPHWLETSLAVTALVGGLVGFAYGAILAVAWGVRALRPAAESLTGFLKQLFRSEAVELSRAQARNIRTIENVIANNAKPHDFSGVASELAGKPIPKPGGGVYDHVTEMKQSVTSLEKSIDGLKGSLENPNLNAPTQRVIAQAIERAETYLTRMREALSGGLQ